VTSSGGTASSKRSGIRSDNTWCRRRDSYWVVWIQDTCPGIENAAIAIAIAITSWPPDARIARAETLTIRQADCINAVLGSERPGRHPCMSGPAPPLRGSDPQ